MSTAVIAAVGFVLPPFIFRNLGGETYGVLSLLILVGSFAQYLDFGIATSLTKFVAAMQTLGEVGRASRIVLAVIMFYCIACGVILLVWFALGDWFVSFIFIGATVPGLGALGALYLLGTSLDLQGSVLGGVLQGFQRLDQVLAANITIQIAKAIITVIVLLLGGGLWGLAWIQVGAAVLRCSLLMGLAVRAGLLLRSWAGWRAINRQDLKELAKLSLGIQGTYVAGLASSQLVRILVVRVAGLESAGIYDLANRVALQVATLPDSLSVAISPAVSKMDASNAHAAMRQLIGKSMRYLLIIGVPACLFVGWFAPEIVRAWLGTENPTIAYAVRVLLVGGFVNVLSGPAYHSLIGLGRPGLGLAKALVWLAMNSTLTVLLGARYGFKGVLAGSTLALGCAAVFLLVESERRYSLGIREGFFRDLSGSVTIAFLGVVVTSWSHSLAVTRGLSINIVVWGGIFCVYMALCIASHWLTGTILPEEKVLLRAVFWKRA